MDDSAYGQRLSVSRWIEWILGIHECVCLLQSFLSMMCSMKYGVFIFFGVWQTLALIFTIFLVPETRGVPIEKVCPCSRSHHPFCWVFTHLPGLNSYSQV